MKKLLVVLSALALLCGCSPKLYNNIKADSVPASHPDYAVIYFYRPGGFVQTPYTVHLGDQPVFRSKNKAKAPAHRVDGPPSRQSRLGRHPMTLRNPARICLSFSDGRSSGGPRL